MAVIVVEDWMIEKVGLKGLDLLAFALIHGCTQRGEGCWHGGYDKLAERIGGQKRGTIDAIKRLEESGYIEKYDAVFDGKKRNAYKSVIDYAENKGAENAHAENAHAENAPLKVQKMHPIINEIKERKKEKGTYVPTKKERISSSVDRLYSLYPSSVVRSEGNRVSLKSSKDKDRLSRLLKTRTEEEVAGIIRKYLSENPGAYIKMFSTFLNNLPDYSDDGTSPTPEPELPLYDQIRRQANKPQKV